MLAGLDNESPLSLAELGGACYIPAAPGAAGYPPAAICPVFFDMPHKDNP